MQLFVKICGITLPADAAAAMECGATAIGVNFFSGSPRYVTDEQAREVCAAAEGAVKIGVFVSPARDEVNRRIDACGLDLVQFHGEESPEFCAEWGDSVIRALRLSSREELEEIRRYRDARMILVDARTAGAYGGTGTRADWRLARAAGAYGKPIVLAGGLTPENVAEAITAVRPAGVDTASGVESAPGIKSRESMQHFVDRARTAAGG